MKKILLDSSINKNLKYDIDNENNVTEEEFREFKFEKKPENNTKINEVAEEDYDYFYQMEREEEMKNNQTFLGKRLLSEAFTNDENENQLYHDTKTIKNN